MFTKLSTARAFVLFVAFTAAGLATATASDAHVPSSTQYLDAARQTVYNPGQFQQIPANPLYDPNWVVN